MNLKTKIVEEQAQTNWYMMEKISYLLKTTGTYQNEIMTEPSEVSRSFSDFEWLYFQLKKNNVGIIVPGMPSKTILAKLNKNIVDTISNEFMEERKQSLQLFIDEINSHEILKNDPSLKIFFFEKGIKFENQRKIQEEEKPNVTETLKETGYMVFKVFQNYWEPKKRIQSIQDKEYKGKMENFINLEKNVNELSDSLYKIIINQKQRQEALNNISHIFENFQMNDDENLQELIKIVNKSSSTISEQEKKDTDDLQTNVYYPLRVNTNNLVSFKVHRRMCGYFQREGLNLRIVVLKYKSNCQKSRQCLMYIIQDQEKEILFQNTQLTEKLQLLEKQFNNELLTFEDKIKSQIEILVNKYNESFKQIIDNTNSVFNENLKKSQQSVSIIN